MSLYKYTDNNNVFNLSDITGLIGNQGFPGLIGNKGPIGDKGPTGNKGEDFDKKTDICFSGSLGAPTPYVSVIPQQLTKIGHFISKNPNEITSIKVLVRPVTNYISSKVTISILNLTTNDINFGLNLIGSRSIYMNGGGNLQNLSIVNLDLSGLIFPAIDSILGIYAQIKQGEDSQLKYLDIFYLSAEWHFITQMIY